jgi:hypothetical protein
MLELLAEIKSAFEKGEFSIRKTSGNFNGIWSVSGIFWHSCVQMFSISTLR